MKDVTDNYNEDSIQVLEGLEAVRKRPGMYIGNVDNKGLHHLVWEIVDNSIDEALAGYATKIKIVLNEDKSITVEDNGRGIPVAVHSKTGISTVETVYTVLHAGGKFGGENSGYKVSGGLHGVGASVVNALSDFVEINIFKNKIEYFVKFSNGGEESTGIKEVAETEKTGTRVKFLPNFDLFNDGVDEFNFKIISDRLKETAYLNKGLEIELINRYGVEKEEIVIYKFDGGLLDFVEELNKNSQKITEDIIYAEGELENVGVEVAMQYTTSYQPLIISYVNNIATTEGGAHEQGFIDAILRIINNYAKDNLSQKEQQVFKREDIKEGLSAVISIKHPNPIYEGQTKNKFANVEVRKIVNELISEKFENYLLENPTQATQILNKVKMAANSRIASMKAREQSRRKDILGFSGLPGKLADCSSKDVEKSELFIVEGDSAGGSAKMGRDREIQAILPLKGKVINAEKTRLDKLLENSEINSLISAIGIGIGQEINLEKLRYGKIIIMTDADVDGAHIRTLLLTFFFRYLSEIIKNGNLFIAQPPLYKISWGRNERYLYTDEEKDNFLKEELPEDTKYSIQRYKGLGEMNDDQLWETTLNPENRKLLKVNIDDASRANKVFVDLMGEFVEPRKEFITKNAKYAKLDI